MPQLGKANPKGANFQNYQLSGGKTLSMRDLGFYLERCDFCYNIEEASEFVSSKSFNQKPFEQEISIRQSRSKRNDFNGQYNLKFFYVNLIDTRRH